MSNTAFANLAFDRIRIVLVTLAFVADSVVHAFVAPGAIAGEPPGKLRVANRKLGKSGPTMWGLCAASRPRSHRIKTQSYAIIKRLLPWRTRSATLRTGRNLLTIISSRPLIRVRAISAPP
jgi:hypothetical protein